MKLKNILFIITLCVIGIIIASFFGGSILMAQVTSVYVPPTESDLTSLKGDVLTPFESLDRTDIIDRDSNILTKEFENNIKFIDADLQTGWMPWIIKQVSILIGGLSLIVFLYAGVSLIIYGDNEEQFSKSIKMLIFGVIGIALAAFSYTLIANVLALF